MSLNPLYYWGDISWLLKCPCWLFCWSNGLLNLICTWSASGLELCKVMQVKDPTDFKRPILTNNPKIMTSPASLTRLYTAVDVLQLDSPFLYSNRFIVHHTKTTKPGAIIGILPAWAVVGIPLGVLTSRSFIPQTSDDLKNLSWPVQQTILARKTFWHQV